MFEQRIAKHTLNSVLKISKTDTLFTVFLTKSTPFHYVLSLYFTPNHSVFFFFIRFEKTYPFPTKMPFFWPIFLAQLEKSTLSQPFLFKHRYQPSWLASAPPPLPPPTHTQPNRGTNSPSMTYAHRISPACRVMPMLFFTSCFCPILPSCKRPQSYVCRVIIHVHFFKFLN